MELLLYVAVRKMVIELAEAGRVIVWMEFASRRVGIQRTLTESD